MRSAHTPGAPRALKAGPRSSRGIRRQRDWRSCIGHGDTSIAVSPSVAVRGPASRRLAERASARRSPIARSPTGQRGWNVIFTSRDGQRLPVPSTYSAHQLTPLSGGIRDGAHLRVTPPPPCPGSAAARCAARARPRPEISGSGSCCSSRRTPTGSPSGAVRRSPQGGPGILGESIRSRARHRHFARASVA